MKKNKGKIALPAARSAIKNIQATEPPNVSIGKARQLLGPDLYRMINKGWLDDDIVAALSDQDENDLRRLLEEARRDERRKRRERDKAKAAKKAIHPTLGLQESSRLVPLRSRGQGPSQPPLLATPGSTLQSLALPAPPAKVEREATPALHRPAALPLPDAPRPITRNRGIRRPD